VLNERQKGSTSSRTSIGRKDASNWASETQDIDFSEMGSAAATNTMMGNHGDPRDIEGEEVLFQDAMDQTQDNKNIATEGDTPMEELLQMFMEADNSVCDRNNRVSTAREDDADTTMEDEAHEGTNRGSPAEANPDSTELLAEANPDATELRNPDRSIRKGPAVRTSITPESKVKESRKSMNEPKGNH
jgi:hypothetical protein